MRKLVILCVWFLMGVQAVKSSTSGCLSVTPVITPASSCDSTGVYLNSCPCDKYLNELTVMFTGASGSNVSVYEDKEHHHLVVSFTNVQFGDLLTVQDNGKKLKKELYFSITGKPDAKIDTDCKGDHSSLPGIEIGKAYGDFTITGYVDEKGNTCSMLSSSGTCVCKKYLAQITMIYTGNPGMNISVYEDKNHHHLLAGFTNVQHGDLLTISNHGKKLKKQTYFVINGMPHVEVGTDCKGTHTVPAFAVGNSYGNFTVAGYIDDHGDRCGMTMQCNGDGAVALNVSGGVAPFTFAWSDGSTAQNISGLCTGYYYFTVTDAHGCSTEDSVFVGCSQAPVNPLEIHGAAMNVPCSGSFFGRVDLQVTGGNPPYQYNWSNGESTSTIIDLQPGAYLVTVTDARGGNATSSFTVKAASCLQGDRCFASPTLPNLVNATSSWTIDNSAQTVTIRTTFSKPFVDNTYGVNAVGWNRGHTFNDLVGSDHLQLVLYDVNGVRKMEFKTDYISASILAPSGYKCLGVTGGDGRMIFGNATDVVGANSSLAENFNAFGYRLTTNSPATDINYKSNPAYPNWIYEVWYEVTINLNAFGGAGFGYPDIIFVHASPSKTGQNSEPVESPCPGCSLRVSGSASPVSMCNSAASCDGNINVNVSGGGPPYAFIWSTGDTTQSISGLCAGMYYVTVTDFGHCVVKDSFFVGCADTCNVSISANPENVSCPGGFDGGISILVHNGVAPFFYHWSSGIISSYVTDLSTGSKSFVVTVTDGNGCKDTLSQTVLITGPEPISYSGTVVNVSCFGASDGSISLTTSGGTQPYQYHWSNGRTTAAIAGLSGGNYTVTISDARGCIRAVPDTIRVTQPEGLNVGFVTFPPLCADGTNGRIDLTVTGGTAPFIYNWSTNHATEDVSGLSAGNYEVSVQDAHGCRATLNIQVPAPQPVAVVAAVKNVSCFGGHDAAIQITPGGGVSPYAFHWSNGASSQDIAGIATGNYSVTVTDDNGCSTTASFTVTGSPQLNIGTNAIKAVTCPGGSDGAIDVAISGGKPPYSYNWSNGRNTEDINNLTSGTFTLTVTDNNGCTISKAFAVNEPPAMNPSIQTVTPVSCNGSHDANLCIQLFGGAAPYRFAWSGGQVTACISNVGSATYRVTVTDANGCVGITTPLTLTQPAPLSLSVIPDNAECYGANNAGIVLSMSGGTTPYTFSWSNGSTAQNLAGVTAGNYSVTVIDAHGCVATRSAINLDQPAPIALGASTTPVNCAGGMDGAIDLTVFGGIAPYNFSWSNGDATEDIGNLAKGTYGVTVEDLNGCEVTLLVTVTEPPSMKLIASKTDVSTAGGNDGAIHITVSGGTSPYAYSWSTGNTTQDLNSIPEGSYSVTVTDANGCTMGGAYHIGLIMTVMANHNTVQMKIFPNPSSSFFNVNVNTNANAGAELQVVDLFNRQLLEKNLQLVSGVNAVPLELGELPPGIYYVVVTTQGQTTTQVINKL